MSATEIRDSDHCLIESFQTHVAVWDPFLRKNPPEIPPYEQEGFEARRYPDDFEEAIITTTEKLKREISELYEEYGFKRQWS